MTALIQTIDWAVLHWIHNTLSCGALDFIMPKITALGNSGLIWIAFAVGLMISPKYRKYGVVMLGALIAGVLIGNVFLKHFVARPRPCWMETVPMLISVPTDFSFPSGHTLASVIGAFLVTGANKKFGWIAIPLAVLIAFSRLYLYVHFPSDVLASVVIGIIIGVNSLLLVRKIKLP